ASPGTNSAESAGRTKDAGELEEICRRVAEGGVGDRRSREQERPCRRKGGAWAHGPGLRELPRSVQELGSATGRRRHGRNQWRLRYEWLDGPAVAEGFRQIQPLERNGRGSQRRRIGFGLRGGEIRGWIIQRSAVSSRLRLRRQWNWSIRVG